MTLHLNVTSIRPNAGLQKCLNYVMLDPCSSLSNYQSTQSTDSFINNINHSDVANAPRRNITITELPGHYLDGKCFSVIDCVIAQTVYFSLPLCVVFSNLYESDIARMFDTQQKVAASPDLTLHWELGDC